MSIAFPLKKIMRMGAANRRALVEALATLAVASAGIKLLSFKALVGKLAAGTAASGPEPADPDLDIRRVRWAVERAAALVPWRTVCFQKGLAAHLMLRRRGIRSHVHYGVRSDADRGLTAHVWVTSPPRPVIGCAEAAGYALLASYPPLPQS